MAPRSPGWVRWLRRARAQTRLWFGGSWSGSALLLGLLVVVADGLLALHASWSVLLSGVELLLLVAWLRTMSGHTRKAPRGREKLMGAVLMLAVCGAFAQKSLHLYQGLSGGGEAAATFYRTFAGVGAVLAVLGVVGRGDRLARFLDAVARQPARVAGLSFTLTILAGGVLLAHPLSLRGEQGAAFLDALFIATSAVCLTGFCPYDVPTTYTFLAKQ